MIRESNTKGQPVVVISSFPLELLTNQICSILEGGMKDSSQTLSLSLPPLFMVLLRVSMMTRSNAQRALA